MRSPLDFLTSAYLAPGSPCELNIDHQLREDVIQYMNETLDDKDAVSKAEILPGVGNSLHASQLANMVWLYEKIQVHIFRLMATDSVPKFVKTDRFISLTSSVFHIEEPAKPVKEDVGRAYLTVSQAANEKQAHAHAQAQGQQL